MRGSPSIVVTALLASALVPPTAAQAATTIGSSLSSLSPAGCSDPPCVMVQDRLPAPARVTSPFQGVVVRWSVKGTGPMRLFVARYSADDVAARVGTSASGIARGATVATSFNTRLPIRPGDLVGIILESSSTTMGIRPDAAGTSFDRFPGSLGASPLRAGVPDYNWELGYNATIEPDRDADGYGDETQDRCPTDPRTAGSCPPPPPPPPPPPDVTPPTFLARPAIEPRRLGRGTAATMTVVLSEDATVTVAIRRVVRRRGRCTRGRARRRRCTRAILVGNVSYPAQAGANTIELPPRVANRRLRVGRYRATLRASDAAGNVSTPARTGFRVVRKRA